MGRLALDPDGAAPQLIRSSRRLRRRCSCRADSGSDCSSPTRTRSATVTTSIGEVTPGQRARASRDARRPADRRVIGLSTARRSTARCTACSCSSWSSAGRRSRSRCSRPTRGVRFSLRGLRRVTTTAQEVAAELSPAGAGLDRRVPVTEEGTEVGQLADSMNTLLPAPRRSSPRGRERAADAAVPGRRLARAAHPADLDPRLRRAGPDAARRGRHDAEDNLARIESEGTRMSRLVEDLLMLARGDADGAAPERSRRRRASWSTTPPAARAPRSRTGAIDVDAMRPMQVVGDPDQLLRVVRNLITNAARAHRARPADPGARVRATVAGVVIQVSTAARACRRRRPRTSSNGSGAPTRRAPGRAAAAGSACRSSPRSSPRTAARCASTARSSPGSTVTVRLPGRTPRQPDSGAQGTIDAMHRATRPTSTRPSPRGSSATPPAWSPPSCSSTTPARC